MREIKFRAWDTKENQMIDWINMRQTAWNRDQGKGYGLMYTIFTNQVEGLTTPGFILMQYTGLKAKNGKEIYEGDIGKWPSGNTNVITWSEDKASFSAVNGKGKGGRYGIVTSLIEIIGNIYENPELLPKP